MLIRTLLFLALFALTSKFSLCKEVNARITYYYQSSRQVAFQKAHRAQKGITIAAHPDFKFGTSVSIPALKGLIDDGKFVVQDRGPAVTKKVASRGKTYVFDVFVNSKAEIQKYAKLAPAYTTVIVER